MRKIKNMIVSVANGGTTFLKNIFQVVIAYQDKPKGDTCDLSAQIKFKSKYCI